MIVNSRESFMFVNVDNRLFQIVRNSEYVDKSEIIQGAATGLRHIIITRAESARIWQKISRTKSKKLVKIRGAVKRN